MPPASKQRLNLELLEQFEVLMRESHVSRAAAAMGIGQPAMSAALARLRKVFGDPLLVATGRGMMPTQRGLELAVQARKMFELVDGMLAPPLSFDPSSIEAHIKIAASEGIAALFMPPLMSFLRANAPGVRVSVQPSDNRRLKEYLEEGRCDLALSFVRFPPQDLRSSTLYPQRVCSIVSRSHPVIRDVLTLEHFLAYPHVSWGAEPIPHPAIEIMVDEALRALGYERQIGMRVPSLLLTPEIVARTDMIATLPERIARRSVQFLDVHIFEPPLSLGAADIGMFWHERTHRDPFSVWLRQTLRDVARQSLERAG
ncbi:MAG: LysR family transcriptional regulator [Burkholderiaceae bacterium]|nr:LysR family transcriptional regulator [Burkholderiaceae bacterium]